MNSTDQLPSKLLYSIPAGWYVMNAAGEIRPAQTYQEIAEYRSMDEPGGEWRPWRQVARTQIYNFPFIKSILISTVFLGLDHAWPRDPHSPLVFETMIFGGGFDETQARYRTIEQARIGHELAVFGARLARFIGPRLAMKIAGYCWSNTAHAALRW